MNLESLSRRGGNSENHDKQRRGKNLRGALAFYLDKAFLMYTQTPLVRLNVVGRVYYRSLKTFPSIASIYPGLHDLRILRWGNEVVMSDGSAVVRLKSNYARMILREWGVWEKHYGVDVSGKTVLDVGAGCGESAWFFFKRGARRVVAIEADLSCIPFLEANRVANGWDMEVIRAVFSPQHLLIPHDFLKLDVEGGELALLDSVVRRLGPCRIELHPTIIGSKRTKEIEQKFGLVRIDREYVHGQSGIYGTSG